MFIALTLVFVGICAGLMYDAVYRAIFLTLAIVGLFIVWLVFSDVDIFSYFVLFGDVIALVTGYVIGLHLHGRTPDR